MTKKSRKPYKFQNIKHSADGFISIGLEITSLLFLVIEIALSIRSRGQAGGFTGFLGFTTLMIAVLGLIFAIISWKDEEANDTSKRIGTLMGIGVVLINVILFVLGIAGR